MMAILVAIVVKNLPVSAGNARDSGSLPGSGRSLEEEMATHSIFLPGESHGQRTSQATYSPQGRTESDTTEAT